MKAFGTLSGLPATCENDKIALLLGSVKQSKGALDDAIAEYALFRISHDFNQVP